MWSEGGRVNATHTGAKRYNNTVGGTRGCVGGVIIVHYTSKLSPGNPQSWKPHQYL